ncbi:MAG: 5-formyltetrahydrofolate cyclo-ligase [Lachnospiraceae bacterium]|nr:5-formyltetrahydrofolate cyclo-ligase [Lachnospiraceae bacterium]
MHKKDELRTKLKTIRRQLTAEHITKKSSVICKKITELKQYESADTVLAYLAVRGEVDVRDLISTALASGKRVAVPKVSGQEMDFYAISDFSCLEIGAFGIPEPNTGICEKYLPGENDIICVPGVAFSESGGRIGQGSGYYDRYLQKNKNLYKIGIGYDFQILQNDAFETEAHDISMDIIISSKGEAR